MYFSITLLYLGISYWLITINFSDIPIMIISTSIEHRISQFLPNPTGTFWLTRQELRCSLAWPERWIPQVAPLPERDRWAPKQSTSQVRIAQEGSILMLCKCLRLSLVYWIGWVFVFMINRFVGFWSKHTFCWGLDSISDKSGKCVGFRVKIAEIWIWSSKVTFPAFPGPTFNSTT